MCFENFKRVVWQYNVKSNIEIDETAYLWVSKHVARCISDSNINLQLIYLYYVNIRLQIYPNTVGVIANITAYQDNVIDSIHIIITIINMIISWIFTNVALLLRYFNIFDTCRGKDNKLYQGYNILIKVICK